MASFSSEAGQLVSVTLDNEKEVLISSMEQLTVISSEELVSCENKLHMKLTTIKLSICLQMMLPSTSTTNKQNKKINNESKEPLRSDVFLPVAPIQRA